MALQIITGDLSVNKKTVIIDRLLEIKEKDPEAIIYYIVPEHLKFDMETFMLERIEDKYQLQHAAMMDIQVVSFSRLAWFMSPTQRQERLRVSSIGLHMIVRQLLIEKEQDLFVYRGQVNYKGFVDKVAALLQELYEGNIESDNLFSLVKETIQAEDTEETIPDLESQRIHELSILYEAFLERIASLDLANFSLFQELGEILTDFEALPHHYIVIDHHYYFNAQEMQLVLQLIKTCHSVWVTLPLSHHSATHDLYDPIVETPKYTYQQLKQLCRFQGLVVLPDWEVSQPQHFLHHTLSDVAEYFKQSQQTGSMTRHKTVKPNQQQIEFWQADTQQTELKHVSNQINYLVSEKGYRYKDIIVVMRDIGTYQSLVQPYFQANDIPVFIDNTTSMSQHPFVILIEGLLNLKTNYYQYDDLMAFLKSDLVIPDFLVDGVNDEELDIDAVIHEKRQQLYYFENIILANGYFGYRLISDFEWQFEEEERTYINAAGEETDASLKEIAIQWRDWLKDNVYRSMVRWDKSMQGNEAAYWIYNLVEEIGIKNQLKRFRDKDIESGDVELSLRDEQVWQTFSELLDEFYLIYQEQEITYDLFSELILSGLYESNYHIIPATLDQVMFTSIESPQVQPYKICFVIGADEHALPQKIDIQSLLDESTRELLKEYLLPHQYLMNLSQQHYSQELLLAYQLLLNATDYLYISYAASINNHTVNLSPYFQQIQSAFELPMHTFTGQVVEEITEPHPSTYGKYSFQRSMIIQNMRYYLEQQTDLPAVLIDIIKVMNQYEQDQMLDISPIMESVKVILEDQPMPNRISPETAIDLYGRNMNASVSKIEQYFLDPFSHFLVYGLRLRERKLFQLDYARTGDYFHGFLDVFTRLLLNKDLSLTDLNREELQRIFRETTEIMNGDHRFNILDSQPRFQAVHEQMNQRLMQFIQFLFKQQENIKTQTIQSEAIFGLNPDGKQLDGYTYPLKSGGNLYISGKIDRIDQIKGTNTDLLQVIDYKSSRKTFDLVDVYYGLDLQVLTYLSVALKNYPELKPFGAFYQPLLQKFNKPDKKLITEGLIDNWETYQMNLNKLNGFVTVDEEELSSLDLSVFNTQKSLIYPASLKKSGEYTQNSSVFDEETLNLLMDYVHYKFQEAANEMQEGIIELRPFLNEQYTTALQPEYRVISGFDATENYELYRRKNINKKEVLQLIQAQLNPEEEENDDNHRT